MSKEVDDMNNKKYCIHGRSENQKCAKCNGMVDEAPMSKEVEEALEWARPIESYLTECPHLLSDSGRHGVVLAVEVRTRLAAKEAEAVKAKELCLRHQDTELELRRSIARLKSMCIVEMMCENLSINHWVTEHEARLERAESSLAECRKELEAQKFLTKSAESIMRASGELRQEAEAKNAALTALLAKKDEALRRLDSSLSEFVFKIPKFPGLSSHALVEVHEKNNFWDVWGRVDKAWDLVRETLSMTPASADGDTP